MFPKITELPELLIASDWEWRMPAENELKHGWWIGVAPDSRKWLLKMTGSFYGYREHVFASLAQRLGISCQSSAYVIIDKNSAIFRGKSGDAEPCQLAICFMDEHPNLPCSSQCVTRQILGKKMNPQEITRARDSGLSYFDDLVRGDILGHLCGQFEPHDHFITRDHEYVVIDNERMFDQPPCLKQYEWLDVEGIRPMIIGVCRGLAGVPANELRSLATVPDGYTVANGRYLYDDLCAAKAAANEYLKIFDE